MSQGLFRFLIFCVSLLTITVIGALALGENKLQFLFHPERSSQSFVMLGFAHVDMREQAETFESEMFSLLENAEGEALWVGQVFSVLEGREADNWSAIALSLYPSRSAFIKQYTKDSFTPPFGISLQNQGASMMLAASPDLAFEENAQVYFLELMQVNELMDSASSFRPSITETALVAGVQGVWTASLNALSGDAGQNWQYVRMTGFESNQALRFWLDSIERKTEASLQQRYYRRYVALIVGAFQRR